VAITKKAKEKTKNVLKPMIRIIYY